MTAEEAHDCLQPPVPLYRVCLSCYGVALADDALTHDGTCPYHGPVIPVTRIGRASDYWCGLRVVALALPHCTKACLELAAALDTYAQAHPTTTKAVLRTLDAPDAITDAFRVQASPQRWWQRLRHWRADL